MQLSLREAATRLGKSERQVRYMIKKHQIRASQVAGRWIVELDDLPSSEGQQQAADRKRQNLRDAVEETLGVGNSDNVRRYSVVDLRAYQIALPIYRAAQQALGDAHAGVRGLRQVIEMLCIGYHRYANGDKRESYARAREEASRALCDLLLERQGDIDALRLSIEQDLIPALSGLIRRAEQRSRRTYP